MTRKLFISEEKYAVRILVIDANRNVLDYYQRILQAKGYLVDVATFAVASQQEIEGTLPDLIILDLLVNAEQELQAWHLAQQLRARASTATIPLLICTAAFILPDFAGFVQENGISVLFKPLEVRELTGTVLLLLSRS